MTHSNRRVSALRRGAALASALLVLACGGPSEDREPAASAQPSDPAEANGEPTRGDWLVRHMLSDPENLNPYTSNDAGATRVLGWVFQSLLDIDAETLELRPWLATDLPQVSDDYLTYTFQLRDDATFSNGTPLTAADVVFSFKVIRHPRVAAPHLRNYLDSVRDVTAPDGSTVRIELREPYFRNRWQLGLVEIIPRSHYDPEALLEGISVAELNDWEALNAEKRDKAERFAKSFNEDYQRNPVGSGAYELAEIVTGERIILRHRDEYWAPGNTDLGDGWVDQVVFRIVNDREAAFVALKSGDLDELTLSPLQAVRQTDNARFKGRFGKHTEIRGSYNYIGWNQTREIFRDKRVRQALSHLVDKRNLIDKVMLGLAEPVESPIFNKRPEYNDALKPWEYSPTKARALLAEAGWTDSDGDGVLDKELNGKQVPLRFELMSNAGNDERKKIGLAVIDSFKKSGIDASFRSVDWSIMLDKVKKFDFDAVVLGWGGSIALPPDSYQIWHSSQAIPGGSNHIAFRNDDVDRILEEYRVEFDSEKRKQLYARFQEIIYDEQPYTFLFAGASVTAWDRRFSGVRWYPGVGTVLNEWWVPASLQKY